MTTTSQILSGLALTAALMVGCGSTHPSTPATESVSEPASHGEGYGYEFAPDAVMASAPAPHAAVPTPVDGRVAPELIQNVIRGAFPQMKACYDTGLARQKGLAGSVTVRFVIARDGKVANVADGGSTLGDAQVVSCVAKTLATLTFPAPSTEVVTVVYPLAFSR